MILENICHLLGARAEREKKLMKNKITRESILMTTVFFFQQAPLYSSPRASLLPSTMRAAKSPVAQWLRLLCQEAGNEQPGESWGHHGHAALWGWCWAKCCRGAEVAELPWCRCWVHWVHPMATVSGPQRDIHVWMHCFGFPVRKLSSTFREALVSRGLIKPKGN